MFDDHSRVNCFTKRENVTHKSKIRRMMENSFTSNTLIDSFLWFSPLLRSLLYLLPLFNNSVYSIPFKILHTWVKSMFSLRHSMCNDTFVCSRTFLDQTLYWFQDCVYHVLPFRQYIKGTSSNVYISIWKSSRFELWIYRQ